MINEYLQNQLRQKYCKLSSILSSKMNFQDISKLRRNNNRRVLSGFSYPILLITNYISEKIVFLVLCGNRNYQFISAKNIDCKNDQLFRNETLISFFILTIIIYSTNAGTFIVG